MRVPDCVKPLTGSLLTTSLSDKFLQNTEVLLVPRPVTFRIVDDQIFIVS